MTNSTVQPKASSTATFSGCLAKSRFLPLLAVCSLICVLGAGVSAQETEQKQKPATSPKANALIDITGYWVAVVDEDWRWRMMTPPKGDFSSIPLNAAGRQVAMAWDLAKDEADGNACRPYGAAGIMRIPTRLHITWANDNTLQIDTDAGMQTRLLHFDATPSHASAPQWQGDSEASWVKQIQSRGFGFHFGGPTPGKGGGLKVVTTHMRPGYLRKNGIPYSGNAIMTEYFDTFNLEGDAYLIRTGVVDDPQYLTERFMTSEQYQREPDASKWHPSPCKTAPPTR
jgi:hypothetical protein